MSFPEKLREIFVGKKYAAAVAVLGISALVLIFLSSAFQEKQKTDVPQENSFSVSGYCLETEKRLEDFLSDIEGAGKVRVYLTVDTQERYIYASEGRHSKSENKTEEEAKYVIVGNGSGKTALVETIKAPEISGAVIACSGCTSPVVQERIYRAASAALGLPVGKIYVTVCN